MSDLFAPDPAYHEGRKPRVAKEPMSAIPEFSVDVFATLHHDYLDVTCTRCDEFFLVPSRSGWHEHHGETRPCPYCFKVSRVP